MSDGSPSMAERATAPGGARSGMNERMQSKIFAGGGVLGALAMSSCCILPLAFFGLGVTGAWIGNLTALYPYKPVFFAVTAAFLAGGFYRVYRKPKAAACADGSHCASPRSDRINKAALWSATLLVLAALAFPYFAPVLLDS